MSRNPMDEITTIFTRPMTVRTMVKRMTAGLLADATATVATGDRAAMATELASAQSRAAGSDVPEVRAAWTTVADAYRAALAS